MNEDDIRLRLLAGVPVKLDNVGEIQPPTLKEIISIGGDLHNHYLSSLLFDKKALENHEEIEHDTFAIFLSLCINDEVFRDLVYKALEMYFTEKPNYQEGFFYFGEIEEERVLVGDAFYEMQQVLKIANNMAEEEEKKFANDKARKLWEKIQKKKKEAEKYSKSGVDLHSLLSGVIWRSSKPRSEILESTIYQLYDGYFRLQNIDQYDHTYLGIYTGNVDGEKMKKELPKINWAAKINLEDNK